MIKNIELENFKGFRRALIPLRSVTLLAGLNSAGKSSVLHAILLLYQIESIKDEIRSINLQGPYVSLGTGKDVLFEGAEIDEIGFAYQANGAHKKFRFAYDATADRLSFRGPSQKRAGTGLPRLHYLCAERTGPRSSYPLSESSAKDGIGINGEFTYHYLVLHGDEKIRNKALAHPNAASLGLLHQVQAWLGEVSPGVKIDIEAIKEADIALAKYGFGSSQSRRPINVGFGLSYTISLITLLLLAERGSLVLLENPEAHVHPSGQAKIAGMIALASKRAQIVVETHSDHIMNGLRVAVREKKIEKPADIQFVYLKRIGDESLVELPEINCDGRLNFWPEGFFDQHEHLLARLIAPRS